MKQYIFLSSLLVLCMSNLVWGGDFEYLPNPTFITSVENHTNLASNISNWYASNMGTVQIKSLADFPTTYCIELSSSTPYTLCQNVQLNAGKKYKLQYSLFSQLYFQQMVLTAYLNNINISSLIILGPDAFSNQTRYFIANLSGQNKLCFDQVLQFLPAYTSGWYIRFGGMIDNISLIEGHFFSINFEATIQQKTSSIKLNSNFTYIEQTASQIRTMYLNGIGKNFTICEFTSTAQGFLSIQIQIQQSIWLKQLQFTSIGDLNAHPFFDISINIVSPNKYIQSLSSFEKHNLQILQNMLKPLYTVVKDTSLFLQAIFCSSYVLTLVSFESLSIFYIFLNIKTVPLFTRQIYQYLLQNLFEMGLTSWIQRTFNLPTNPFQVYFQDEKVIQTVKAYKDQQKWFGYYGLSSLFFKNNTENFLVLAFLIIKIIILYVVVKRILQKTSLGLTKYIKKRYIIPKFIIEFISMSPTFIVSASAKISSSNYNFIDSLEKICQIVMVFLCMFLMGLYFIEQYRQKKCQGKKKKKAQKKLNQKQNRLIKIVKITIIKKSQIMQQKTNNKKKHQYHQNNDKNKNKKSKSKKLQNDGGDIILFFTIPFTLVITDDPKLFFVINSIALFLKIVSYFHSYSTKSRFQKIIQPLINLVWVSHHIIFILFYVLQQKYSNLNQMSYNTQVQIVQLGFAAIITILVGCCLQILKFLASLIQLVIFCIKFILNHCRTKIKLQPIKQQKLNQIEKQQQSELIYVGNPIKKNNFNRREKSVKIKYKIRPQKQPKEDHNNLFYKGFKKKAQNIFQN